MSAIANDFSALCGNTAAKERFARAVRASTLPHAILLAGPKGSGKHTLALLLAAAQNCERKEGGAVPCGACGNCRRILAHNHPDVKTLGKIDGKATIGVTELRAFREDMFLSATETAHRFYLIEDAQDMTPPAQNALLKVLEEPPRGVYILLLAEATDPLLSTIRSRAQLTRMEPIADDALAAWLRRTEPAAARMASAEPERFSALVRFSDGRIGRARGLLDAGALAGREEENERILGLLRAMHARAPYTSIHEAVFSLPQKRAELRDVFELLLIALRDAAVCSGSGARPLFFASAAEAAGEAGMIGDRRVLALFDAAEAALEDIDKNVAIQTLLADFAAGIARR